MNPTTRRAARLYAVLVIATAAATLIPTLDAAGDEPDPTEELEACPDGFAPTGDPLYPCHDLASGPDPCTDEADTIGVPCPDDPGADPVQQPDPIHDPADHEPEEPRHEAPEPAHEAEPEPVGDTTREPATPVQAIEEPHEAAPVAAPAEELPATGLPDPLLALIGGTMLAAGALILRATSAGEVHP